jgi:hypothetical protein
VRLPTACGRAALTAVDCRIDEATWTQFTILYRAIFGISSSDVRVCQIVIQVPPYRVDNRGGQPRLIPPSEVFRRQSTLEKRFQIRRKVIHVSRPSFSVSQRIWQCASAATAGP